MHPVFLVTAASLAVQTASAAPAAPAWNKWQPAVRRERTSLSLAERKEYTDAVLCLYAKPSRLPSGEVPGALNRRDDFTAVHINQNFAIHLDAVFLGWHRNFLNLYETALREECGYTGYQPYWDWTKSINDISAYPLFNGSEYSIIGNGKHDPSTGDYNLGPYHYAHGTGGGCVSSGPFTNLSSTSAPSQPPSRRPGPPHKLDTAATTTVSIELSTSPSPRRTPTPPPSHSSSIDAPDIAEFQSRMSACRGTKPPGPHTAGHLQIGMDMFDLFTTAAATTLPSSSTIRTWIGCG